jgi:arylsulfatase A-like enzyme
LVNPHDISFAGGLYERLLGFNGFDDTVPSIGEPPSQGDSFAGRPACQEQFKATWPQMVSPQPTDDAYRRLYYYLHKKVDQAITRILDALEASGLAENTIIVFTSDHGELLGAHGGLQQKWCNAFDEAIRVPLLVSGPGIVPRSGGDQHPHDPCRSDPHPVGFGRHRRGWGRRCHPGDPPRRPTPSGS